MFQRIKNMGWGWKILWGFFLLIFVDAAAQDGVAEGLAVVLTMVALLSVPLGGFRVLKILAGARRQLPNRGARVTERRDLAEQLDEED